MFSFSQSSGKLWRPGWTAADHFEAFGYSGYSSLPWPLPAQYQGKILPGEGRNIPNMQEVHDIGPLPRGIYTIGAPYDHPKLGPITFDLAPDAGVKLYGRSLFRIHPDGKVNPGTHSHGCICASHSARIYIAAAREGKVDKVLGLHEPFFDNRLEVLE